MCQNINGLEMKVVDLKHDEGGLTGRQNIAAMALVRSGSVRQVALESGISEATLWRYRQNPEFQRRIRELTESINKETEAAIRSASTRAVSKLLDLMDTADQDTIKYAAAKTILDLHFKTVEINEIERQLEELRRDVQGLGPRRVR